MWESFLASVEIFCLFPDVFFGLDGSCGKQLSGRAIFEEVAKVSPPC